jgi:hypothetical protein
MNGHIKLEYINPPAELANQIMVRIKNEQQRHARITFAYTSTISVVSAFFTYTIVTNLAQEFTQSGFYDYLSLMFSNGSNALTYWKEFTLTLAESFPAFGVIIFLSVGLATVISTRSAFNNSKVMFSKKLA